MIKVILPSEDKSRRAPFYLAMEEWVARELPRGEYCFCWIVGPTVVMGRNQDFSSEIDRDYCLAKGIDIVRRKSGGGCVYADRDNVMFAYICGETKLEDVYARFTEKMVEMLCGLGVKAEATGRNDITVDGGKVSGCAFLHLPGRSIVHSTMLYSTNLENMVRAITPSKSKLESKKVKSVSSRITTLNRYLDCGIEKFRDKALDLLCDSEIVLSEEQVEEIREIERGYYKESWLLYGGAGDKSRWEGKTRIQKTERIEGAGQIRVEINLDGENKILDVNLSGDYFELKDDVSGILSRVLKGAIPKEQAIREAFKSGGVDAGDLIRGLDGEDLPRLLEINN